MQRKMNIPTGLLKSREMCPISERMKQDCKKVLQYFPKGLWASDFPSKYQQIIGLSFDFQSQGYCNFLDLVVALPDVFVRRQLQGCKSDWLLYDVETFDEVIPISEPKMPVLNPEEKLRKIISNIRNLLQANPEGITTEEFYPFYKLNFDEMLRPLEFGYNCLNTFLVDIKDAVPLTMKFLHNKLVIYFDVLRYTASNDPVFCVPEDVVDIITVYKKQCWPSASIFDSTVELSLVTADDPANMWMNLKGKETSVALQKLQVELKCFYNENSEDYMMHNNHVIKGAVCAGKWSCRWFRIKIYQVLSDDIVMAFFVDHGFVNAIKKSDLRYLRKIFFDLPGQAIKARLADIKPQGRVWEKDAVLRLIIGFSGKPLVGYVNAFSLPDCVLHIFLFHVRGVNDVVVLNDVLVAEEYAIGCDDASEFKNLVHNPKPFSSIYKASSVNALESYKHASNEFQMLHSLMENQNDQKHQPRFLVDSVDHLSQQLVSMKIGSASDCYVNTPSEVSSEVHFNGSEDSSSPSSKNSNCSEISSVSALHSPNGVSQNSFQQDKSSLYTWARNISEQMPIHPPREMQTEGDQDSTIKIKPKSIREYNLSHGSPNNIVDGYIRPPNSLPYSINSYKHQISEFESPVYSPSQTQTNRRPARNKEHLETILRKPLANRSVFKIDKEIRGCYPHLIRLVDRLHISSSDIATLLWRSEDSNLVFEKARKRKIASYPITLYGINNEKLFVELVKHSVRGIEQTKYKGVTTLKLAVYSLVAALPIFEVFGNPDLVGDIKALIREHDPLSFKMLLQVELEQLRPREQD